MCCMLFLHACIFLRKNTPRIGINPLAQLYQSVVHVLYIFIFIIIIIINIFVITFIKLSLLP